MTSSFFTQIGNDINGEAADDNSGFSLHLSADGSIVAIGSPWNDGNDGNGSNSGHIRIYKNVNNTWTQLGNNINGEADDDEFGYSVNISDDGNVVAVGAHQNSTGNGYVRIYKNVNNTWTKVGTDIEGEGVGDNLGRSVSLSSDGNVVAIGAILHEASGNATGSVRILKNINNTWTQIGSDIDGEDDNNFSGRSVSLSSDGSIIAIGADWNDGNGTDSGHVRIYKNINDTWTQVGIDIDGEDAGDRSGWAVSLSSDGSIVAIGATDNDGNGTDSGHVRIYKNINDTWSQVGSDIDGENTGDFSGVSVSLSSDGTIVAIGSIGPLKDLNGTNSGYVRIYKNINNTWTQIGSDLDGEAAGDSYGTSVSLSSEGTIVAIGAGLSDKNGNNSGHVGIYQIDIDTTPPNAPSSLSTSSLTNDNTPTISGIAEVGSTVRLYNGSISDNKTITYNVSVEAKTSEHNSFGSGSSFGYKINNNFAPYLSLTPGNTYIFDQSDTSNINHPLLFYLDSNKTNSYSENVLSVGTPGTSGAYTQINITSTTPETLHYQCSNHGLMGDSLRTNLGSAIAASNGAFSITTMTLSDGNYSLTATATDATGHISDSSSPLNITISSASSLTDFQALNYIASNTDLISSLGIDIEAAKTHYTNYGESQGRSLDSFSASDYLAKYSDLSAAFGSDQTLALNHYIEYGFSEGRTDTSSSNVADSGSGSGSSSGGSSNLTDFQALNHVASYGDLINAFGTDLISAKSHYTDYGKSEGRTLDDFDEWGYLASNNDLINSLGSDTTEAVKHYISYGYSQGKITNSFDAQSFLNNYGDLRNAFGNDLELATRHYVEYGFNEGRVF